MFFFYFYASLPNCFCPAVGPNKNALSTKKRIVVHRHSHSYKFGTFFPLALLFLPLHKNPSPLLSLTKVAIMAADEINGMNEQVNDQEIAPFDPTKKKKKKKVVDNSDSKPVESKDDVEDLVGNDVEEGEAIDMQQQRYPWERSDRDYTYEELLGTVFNTLRENNPELAGDRRRTIMRPPQVLREGIKKTVFVNFMDLCKTMHRQPDHVMTYVLDELGTSGSLDGKQRLVVKGRFAAKNFEAILRKYIYEYVICSGCKSPNTILSKENRLFFLRCEKCGSWRSVTYITKGFVARVGRRKAEAPTNKTRAMRS